MFVPTNSRRATSPKLRASITGSCSLPVFTATGVRCEVYHRDMSGIGSELVDSSPADRSMAFDTLVREEPDDEDEEDEEDEEDDEDDGNSDGYSE